jgi:4-aminobutyrate aminotransferase-like enzyme
MLPEKITQIPGPLSLEWAQRLRKHESRHVTYVSPRFPVFWERALGANVWDVDGNCYLDLTSGFGVATAGFGAEPLVKAYQSQSAQLYHGMGDVHPTRLKVELCELLSQMTFERWQAGVGKVILGNAGFEAVEVALKTAYLWTGKAEVVAFQGGYHGLGYGALSVTGRGEFRSPFQAQLKEFAHFLPYPGEGSQSQEDLSQSIRLLAATGRVGAVLVEPVQGRGGEIFPPDWFLPLLRRLCNETGLLLILDEIYTGFYRCGNLFACERVSVVPDLICLGKAMSGSFPISACVGREEIMDAWPESSGEALHTSTFLGHPVGCALALASLRMWIKPETADQVRRTSDFWKEEVQVLRGCQDVAGLRGRGLLWGIELRDAFGNPLAARVGRMMEEALAAGLIVLGGGVENNVITLSPNLCVTREEARWALALIRELLESRA